FLEPAHPLSHVLCSWVVRSVCKPRRDIPRAKCIRYRDALDDVIECHSANLRIRIPHGPIFVFLVLKDIGIYRTRRYAILRGERLDLTNLFQPLRKIPLHMQRHRGTSASELVDLSSIAELILNCGCCSGLQELTEPSACICKSPGRQLHL